MNYKTYDNYKKTKIMWIDSIPTSWDTIKAKHCFDLSGGYSFKSDDFVEEGIPLIRIGDIKNGTVDIDNCKRLPFEYGTLMKEYLVTSGDILIALTGGTIGKIGQVPKTNEKLLLNQRGKLSSTSPNYYKYVLNSDFIKKQIILISEGSAQENISTEDIENFEIFDIDDNLKEKISNYLDKRIAKINKNIAKNEELIQLLEEKHIALIYQIVTKGLNPHTPMKNSEIKWIDKIPVHWEINRLSYYFKQSKNRNITCKEQNLLSLSYGKIIQKDINSKDGLLPENFDTYNIVEKNDIVLRLTDLQNDKKSLRTGLVKEKGIITSAYVTIRKNSPKININYAHYLLHGYDLIKVYYNMGGGVRQNLNYKELSYLPFLEPPYKEQKEIANYLDRELLKIDELINKIKKQNSLLNEYKSSLIHHVITGKINVSTES